MCRFMMRLLIVAIVAAVVVAGCGSSSESESVTRPSFSAHDQSIKSRVEKDLESRASDVAQSDSSASGELDLGVAEATADCIASSDAQLDCDLSAGDTGELLAHYTVTIDRDTGEYHIASG